MAMVAQMWTLSGLAVELGMDRRAVGRMLAGVPADGEGPRNASAWLMKTAIEAMMGEADVESGKLDPAQERARKDRELADKTAMENEARRGQLVDRADVDAAVIGAFSRVRSRLLSIPSKAAPLVAQDLEIAEIEHLIRSQVIEALQELSETNVAELADDHGGMVEGVDAAA